MSELSSLVISDDDAASAGYRVHNTGELDEPFVPLLFVNSNGNPVATRPLFEFWNTPPEPMRLHPGGTLSKVEANGR